MQNTSLILSAAYGRSGRMLQELKQARSRDEQMRVIADETVAYTPLIGWTGGPFDLRRLLDDLTFAIPRRSRHESEKMISEAIEKRIAIINMTRQWNREDNKDKLIRRLPLIIVAALGVFVAFNPHIILDSVNGLAALLNGLK